MRPHPQRQAERQATHSTLTRKVGRSKKRMKENSNRLVAGTGARPEVSMFLRLSAPERLTLLGPTGPLGQEEMRMKRWPSLLTVPGALEHGDASSQACMSGGLPYLGRQLREPTGHIIKNLPLLHLADGNSVVTAQQSPTACTEGCHPPALAPGALSLCCPSPEAKGRAGRPPYSPGQSHWTPTPGVLCVAPYLPHRLALPCPAHPMFLLPVWASRASGKMHAQPRRSRVQGQASLTQDEGP